MRKIILISLALMLVVSAAVLTGCKDTRQTIWSASFPDGATVDVVIFSKDVQRSGLADALKVGTEAWFGTEVAKAIGSGGYVAVTAIRAVFATQDRKRSTNRISIKKGELGALWVVPVSEGHYAVAVLMKEAVTEANIQAITKSLTRAGAQIESIGGVK